MGAALEALAERLGIFRGYRGADGVRRQTTDEARVALLAALGIAAPDDAAASRVLAELDAVPRAPATRVLRAEAAQALPIAPAAAAGRAELRLEDGSVVPLDVRAGAPRLQLPPLPAGVHELWLEGTPDVQRLLAAPPACTPLEEKIGTRRVFGLWTNLYSVRGARDQGAGHLGDLHELARFAAARGAAFVGINPLHAHRNRPPEVSPYGGISRIFRNATYVDLEAVPELASSDEARALLASQATQQRLRALRASDRIDYAAVDELLRPVMRALQRAFAAGAPPARQREYAAFRARDGGLVVDFATFRALEDEMTRQGPGPDWRGWPAELRDPRSAAVDAFRRARADEIETHVFTQFEIERQLGLAARAAELPIGLYQDLALGSLISGFDAWAFQDLFVAGASLGAPPDAYAAQGQDWGIPPLDPRALAADGYRYWRLVLRASMASAGALRIDHAMGLTRQFWVPAGRTALDGAYVRYPVDELLAVLAIESRWHGCVVIGEDLGTVPPGFAAMLARAGILSSRVMMFERGPRGSFRRAASYSKRALVTANTHDHATFAAWVDGTDIDLRAELGLVADPDAAHAERAHELAQLRRRLHAEGVLADGEAVPYADLCAAVQAFLARTPAPLLGVSVDDLAAELRPVNVPGVPQERYPSWTRRMHARLDELARDPDVQRALEGVASRRLPAEGCAGPESGV